jgi:hypothetical protein
MEHVDPYKVIRNTATLQAYRDRQRAAWRSAQPFLAICGGAYVLVLLTDILALRRGNNGGAVLVMSLLFVLGGLSGVVAALRVRRYLRDHPSAVVRS